jgi:von Willebrand factor type A domain/Viral BACON domain
MPCEAARLAATGTEAPTWGRSTGAETTRTLIMRRFKTLELTLALALIGVVGVGCPVTNPPGPVITVNPGEVGFGTAGVTTEVDIYNTGTGTLIWSVNEDISWLTVTPATGTTTTDIDKLTLTVDRTGLAADTYHATFTIGSTGGNRSILVSMTTGDGTGPSTGEVEVSPTTLNILYGTQATENLTITNGTTAPVTWALSLYDPASPSSPIAVPDWLILDQGDTVPAGIAETYPITVDTASVPSGAVTYLAVITWNGGSEEVNLNIGEGLTPEIGVVPTVLDYGTTLNILSFEVFNTGSAGSVLEFVLTTDRPDLILFDMPPIPPDSLPGGVSIGTNNSLAYDRVEVPVLIDRNGLTGNTDGGTITITDQNNSGVEPVEVLVNVEAALTFEAPQNRTRPPFILRFVFLLRDQLGLALDTLNDTILAQLPDNLTIFEDGETLDDDETEVFFSSALGLRQDIVLLLDYTGSMFAAMQALNPGSADPLQELYAGTSGDLDDGLAAAFIDSLPNENFSLSLMEYHERQQVNRVVHPFSSEPDSLKQELDNLAIPAADHGATELYDALIDAIDRLVARDAGELSFEDADVRALIFISDGRDTSSVESISNVIENAKDGRVRLYPIGFGESVNTVGLLQMALETGGHYYSAPDLGVLTQLLAEESSSYTGTGGLIIKELQRQVVITYNTLFQEGSHTYAIEANRDDFTGFINIDGVFATGGDVRAGQITLYTNGISPTTGTATVLVRTEYVPRNITQFRFRVWNEGAYPFTVSRAAGGLLDSGDWFEIGQVPAPIPESEVLYFITGETNPIQFSAFGNLLQINLSGFLTESDPGYDPNFDFDLEFRADNQIYIDPPYTKFFQYEDKITISYEPSRATPFPVLVGEVDPDALFAWDRDEDGIVDFDDREPDIANGP